MSQTREKESLHHGIRRLPKKEKTPYKSSDIWDAKEHAIFLKYCPDKRDKAFHAMANDTSTRPHELLNLKIRYRLQESRKRNSTCRSIGMWEDKV